jgi:hypothetical protein
MLFTSIKSCSEYLVTGIAYGEGASNQVEKFTPREKGSGESTASPYT